MSRQEMFREYPDVVNIEQLCEMLEGSVLRLPINVCTMEKSGFLELEGGFRIPKEDVIRFVRETSTRIKRCLTFK